VKRFAHERGARKARAAFTLIELAIATSILMIGIVSVLSASSQMHSLRKVNRERTLAQNALRSLTERMHASAHGFADEPDWATRLLATYGPNGSHGDTFAIEGLAPLEGQTDVGRIVIGTDETDTDAAFGADVGLPRDLNGDGDATDGDVSGNARLLPVILVLRWRGENGAHQMRHGFYLMGY
jgi:type II secretory pathway pseudopilin PulG